MPPRTHTLADADRAIAWLRVEAGRELRVARHAAGATMAAVGLRLGWSKSKISRIERGLSPRVTLADIARCAAVVGLRASLRLFPSGRALRDIGQVQLLAALNARMHHVWRSSQEVPVPIAGDLRAADQVSELPGCRLMIEAYRRFSDWQLQTRAARLKQRDLGATRLLLLLEDTLTNRRAVAAAGEDLFRSFPVSQRAMLAALGAGRDPGGDGIVFLRRLDPAPGVQPIAIAPRDTKAAEPDAPTSPVASGATQRV